MNILVVIPERMSAKRFPGKPLAPILGVPMVGHILARSLLAKHVDGVYVASPDNEILEYVGSVGGKGGKEYDEPKNAPATVARALPDIEKDFGKSADWIIMVQGDEPMIHPDTIDGLALYVRSHPEAPAVNIIANMAVEKEIFDPNIVKIVLNEKGEGVWFFRTPTERWREDVSNLPIKKQTGIIAFRREFLLELAEGGKTPLEKIESVDMFRLIEKGGTVPTMLIDRPMYSVDTEEDRVFVEGQMKDDPFLTSYAQTYGRTY